MTTSHSIAVIAGDGIGQEVVPAAIECLERIAGIHGLDFDLYPLTGARSTTAARADDAR